jgi:hypothetical protein
LVFTACRFAFDLERVKTLSLAAVFLPAEVDEETTALPEAPAAEAREAADRLEEFGLVTVLVADGGMIKMKEKSVGNRSLWEKTKG